MEWVRERSGWISGVARGKAEPAAAAKLLHLVRSTNEGSWAQTHNDIEVLRKKKNAHFATSQTENLPDFFAPLLAACANGQDLGALLSACGGGEGFPPAEGPE